jgi:hypothetical protein
MNRLTKKFQFLAIFFLISFSIISSANAADTTLYTQIVFAEGNNTKYLCRVTNLGYSSLVIKISVYDSEGGLWQSTSPTVKGGQTYELSGQTPYLTRCEFTYASTGKVRANISALHFNDLIAFSEAR